MEIKLTKSDFAHLSRSAQDEIIALLMDDEAPKVVEAGRSADMFEGYNMQQAAYLTPDRVDLWMERASEKTKAGLRVFAEKGPIVSAQDLRDAGIENIGHFQSRVTTRTRTVMKDPHAFLFAWDVWETSDDGEMNGHYAVVPMTYNSLRRYFGLAPDPRTKGIIL